jgi:hypothetical protein
MTTDGIPPIAPPADFSALPRNVDRRSGADIVTRHFFPINSRTLERWPLTWRMVNGRGVCETSELLALAQEKLDAAPALTSVRRRIPAEGRRASALSPAA